MWPDNDIDKAFQRLDPPEPEPAPFPLDAWLRLEARLDQELIARQVRQKLWRYFAAEVAAVLLLATGWLLWPAATAPAGTTRQEQNAMVQKPNATAAASERQVAGRAASKRLASSSAPPLVVATPPVTATKPALEATTAASQLLASSGAPANEAQLSPSAVTAAAGQARAPQRGRTTAAPARRFMPTALPAARVGEVAVADTADADGSSVNTPGISETKVNSAPLGRALATHNDATENQPSAASVIPAASQASEVAAASGRMLDPENPDPTDLPALAARPTVLEPGLAAELPGALPTTPVVRTDIPTPIRPARIFVGVVAAPEVSTVKFADVQRPLSNLGVVVEYRITDRLRLASGVLRSTKHYTARRDDYDWGDYRAAVYRHDFRDVDGSCTVIDVPLNLRYDFVARSQFRLFASTGLSSFFMRRERYAYTWQYNNATYYWAKRAKNENHHLLRIVNLSLGYERRLGPRWSLQAEPYLKLPLSGVGAGKVRLVSGGVFLGVKRGF